MPDIENIISPANTTSAVEGVTEEVKAEEVKSSEPESKRLAALIRKDKNILVKQQELKSAEARLAEREAKIAAQEAAFKSTASSAKLNPIQALESLGLTYEELTQFVLNNNKATPDLHIKAVRDELETFKRQQQTERQQFLEEEKKRIELEQKRVIDDFHGQCLDFVKTHEAEYELINIHDAGDLVIDVIEQNFAKTQKILSTKEAADLVEQYLEEQTAKAVSSKKWQAKQQSKLPKEVPQQSLMAQQRTLNNGLTTSTASFLNSNIEQDRMKRALAALEGKHS